MGCFTPARGKSMQKNREVSRVKVLDCVVSGASFLTVVCLSVTLHFVDLWQYYVCCTRSGAPSPSCTTQCTLLVVIFLCRMCRWGLHIAHRYTYAPPRCRTLQYHITFIPLSVSLWNDLGDPMYSMVWGWQVSRAGPMPFYCHRCPLPFYLLMFSVSLPSLYGLVLSGWGLRTDMVFIALSQPCIADLF